MVSTLLLWLCNLGQTASLRALFYLHLFNRGNNLFCFFISSPEITDIEVPCRLQISQTCHLVDPLFETHLLLTAAFHPKVLFWKEFGGLKVVDRGLQDGEEMTLLEAEL